MESFFVRYRNLLVLLLLLVAQIIGLASQVHRSDTGRIGFDTGDGTGVRLLRLWANAVVSPPERAVEGSRTGISGFWQDYFDLRKVREQNKDLQNTIDRLRLEEASLLEVARQGQRLEALMNFQHKYVYSTVAAQIIGSSGTDQSHVFYIDKGKDEGIGVDMAVITSDGIVGKIREVYPHSAQILAINDQSSGAGVILETNRIRGILRGNAEGQVQVVGILADQRIQPGEKVLTAGGDEIFPRGLPVGVVDKVVRDPDRDAFIDIFLKPAAHIDRLDEVMVITATGPRLSAQQEKDLDTSEALKGAEAAENAEKKKAAAIMAERLPGLVDPNLPTDQQPLYDSSNPVPVSHPPAALHPDRFTPGGSANTGESAASSAETKPEKITPAKAKATGDAPDQTVDDEPKPVPPAATTAKPAASKNPARQENNQPPLPKSQTKPATTPQRDQ